MASLGAVLRRDEQAGGYVVEHIYLHDPDLPNEAPPLARPDSIVHEGEVIVSIDGDDLLGVAGRAGAAARQGRAPGAAARQIALPGRSATSWSRRSRRQDERNLRYKEWEYTRRLKVESDSQGHIGYVHLRAMGSGDIEQWARDFYPVFDRQGLIIDVRHNGGGNIDSWLLGKAAAQGVVLLAAARRQSHLEHAIRVSRAHGGALRSLDRLPTARPSPKASAAWDWARSSACAPGAARSGYPASNTLADSGIATAAEMGVYGPEGKWLIEGHGVDPDIVVDNLPHATFGGQRRAA